MKNAKLLEPESNPLTRDLDRSSRALARLAERYPALLALLDEAVLGVVFHLGSRIVAANALASRMAGRALSPTSELAEVLAETERELVTRHLIDVGRLGFAPYRRRYRVGCAALPREQVELETVVLQGFFEGDWLMMTLLTPVPSEP